MFGNSTLKIIRIMIEAPIGVTIFRIMRGWKGGKYGFFPEGRRKSPMKRKIFVYMARITEHGGAGFQSSVLSRLFIA
jgi:hypothetical protein